MSDDSQRAGRAGLPVTVTVSRQPAFVPTLEAITMRIGEYVGCPAEAARHLGQAVALALGQTWRHLGPDQAPARFHIVFHGDGRLLKVDLACMSPLPAGVTLEAALGGADGVTGLRQLVDRIEFGDADGCPYCRLTRQIRDGH
jgi:hypothetical protein